MALLKIAEVFGNDTSRLVDSERRKNPHCPFRESPCTKQGKVNPLGICSFTDGKSATVVCPVRFLETGRLVVDAARVAFGLGKRLIAMPEYRLLEVSSSEEVRKKKIGKVDFLLALLNEEDRAIDFAALEIQAVYISGRSIRPAFNHYLKTGRLSEADMRRPDYRSSAQKRLMPQLALKVPVFRRWGKRFFVAVDQTLFATLPPMKSQSTGNSEVTWLVYPFTHLAGGGFPMGNPVVYHTTWDDVVVALREGTPPEKDQLLEELSAKAKRSRIYET